MLIQVHRDVGWEGFIVIAAVATILNDADIVGGTILNLYDQGVDEVYVALSSASDDTTWSIVEPLVDRIFIDDEPYHYQPRWINYLADLAGQYGATWIIPFDADEFWYALAPAQNIADALNTLEADVCSVTSYQHRDMEYRFTELGMGKVAYRWHPGAVVANGNHSVSWPNARVASGVLALREIQFRSFDHMVAKCHERTDRIDPTLPYSEGTHQRVLAAMTPEELQRAWVERNAREVIYDPVPLL